MKLMLDLIRSFIKLHFEEFLFVLYCVIIVAAYAKLPFEILTGNSDWRGLLRAKLWTLSKYDF